MSRKHWAYPLTRLQILALAIFLLMGILHPYIARDATEGKGGLIPYAASTIDKANRNVSPLGPQEVSSLYYRHWLGTDPIGRDLLAGLLSGAGVALKVGFFSILLSLIIGTLFGYLAGYFGDNRLRWPLKIAWLIPLWVLLSLFYILYAKGLIQMVAILSLLTALGVGALKAERLTTKGMRLPIDLSVIKLVELTNAIPSLFLILVLLALMGSPSVWKVIFIIALVRWPSVTRYLRAEVLKIKEMEFVRSAQGIGLSDWKIFKDNILPLAASPVIVASALGFAYAVLAESTLSFLGIGVPAEVVTWGSLLTEARRNFSSWWLAFFPGLMIYLVILLFNSIGDRLDDYVRGE